MIWPRVSVAESRFNAFLSPAVWMLFIVVLARGPFSGVFASDQPDVYAPVLTPAKHGGVFVVAHRGAHNGIPENSLPAYEKAIELGVDFVEIDVRATKDGKLVSIHNATVDAYVDGVTGKVSGFTFEEIRALDIGIRVGPEWENTRVPTLQEILQLCKGKCGIYLDLKDPAVINDVAEQIRRHRMENDVLWYGPIQYTAAMKQLRRRNPGVILMPDPLTIQGIPFIIKELSPRVIAASWRHYSQDFVDQCHAANAIVIVDESDSSCWGQAVEWGSDGIQTDEPEKLIEFLKTRSNAKKK